MSFSDLGPLPYDVVPPGVHALTGQVPRVELFASSTFCYLVVIDKDFVGKAVLWHFYLKTLLTSVIFFFRCSMGPVPQRLNLSSIDVQGFQDQKG